MTHWGLRRFALNSGFLALLGLPATTRVSAEPAPNARSVQIYQGELDGQEVWVELTRTARGISGKLGASLLNLGALTTLELPPPAQSEAPAAFIPQRLDATSCKLSVASTHPNGLQAACLQSLQGATFLAEGFPELILEDDPSSPGKQFWLRAVAPKSADALAQFGAQLRQAEPLAAKACARSVRIDDAIRPYGRSFLAYWTWDFCGAAVLAAARAGKAEPGKGPWRETAWLGVLRAEGGALAHVAVGQRRLANDQLILIGLGHPEELETLDVLSIQQRYQDSYPTGFSAYSQTRVYAAPERGSLVLALGPLLSHEISGVCSGSDLETRWFDMGPDAPADELIVRTTNTYRVRVADACEARDRVTYGGYRFNLKTAKYAGFYEPDAAGIVKWRDRHTL